MSHRFVIAVCQGRMCTALGGDALAAALTGAAAAAPQPAAPCAVTRGGCYGLCELAPNVVVRRLDAAQTHDAAADRLTLTHAANETVYSLVGPDDAARLVVSHLQQDAVFAPATRARRETQLPPKGEVAARMRALRARRAGQGSSG